MHSLSLEPKPLARVSVCVFVSTCMYYVVCVLRFILYICRFNHICIYFVFAFILCMYPLISYADYSNTSFICINIFCIF